MANHPNRGQIGPYANPAAEEVKVARKSLGLTQPEAAMIVKSSMRAWQQWESGERRMHPGLWELFQIKTS